MCDPVTAMTVLAVAGAGASAVSSFQQANAQVSAANQQARAQAEETQAANTQQAGERTREARREQARIRVAAGESGVAGGSFEAQLMDSFGRQNQDLAVIQKQSSFSARAINANLKSNTASTKGVNGISAGLQIAGAGAQGFSQGLSIKAQRAAAV